MQWGLKEAKQKFNEMVKRAEDEGPQVVTREGKAVVEVVAAAQYEQLAKRNSVDGTSADPEFDPSVLDEVRAMLRREIPREVEL